MSDPINLQEANDALEKAKYHLLRKPNTVFYTTILFSLVQTWTDQLPTAGVNGVKLFINPEFFMGLSEEERVGLLVHEVLHVALNHMTRLGDRDPKRWNKAADYVINNSLKKAGYTLPACGLFDDSFKNDSTEQAYAKLDDDPDPDNNPGGFDIQYPDDPDDVQEIARDVADIVQKAQMTAKNADSSIGDVPGEMEIAVNAVLDPILPWHIIYMNYMTSFAKDDFSWRRPNRRYQHLYLPSAHSEKVGEIATAVDASCSVRDHEFDVYIGQHVLIQEILNPEKITVLTFDTSIKEIQEITENTNILKELSFTGRGGTDVTEVFQWAKENNPLVLTIFTDGEFYLPDEDTWPTCPIVWIIHNNKFFTSPIGEVIHINI
jgi:predicted metal-dependent peptidase